VTVRGVQAGQLYRFETQKPDGEFLQRFDAAGRDVISSDLTRDFPNGHNASIVLGSDASPWAPFVTPQFQDLLERLEAPTKPRKSWKNRANSLCLL
jgi:1,4-alpha-glucan branching enzyme